MKIQVVGTDCPTCKVMFEKTKNMVKDLEIDTEVEYINDMKKMIDMGMMTSPILVIEDKPVLSGREFNEENLREVLLGKFSPVENGCGGGCSGCGCGS